MTSNNETLSIVEDYEKVRIMGVKIIPNNKQLPFGFVGTCPYCGSAPCARISGKPCRHPEKVRPSLEAFGFDMSKTAKDLLGLEIKWSQGELIPEYLTLVCGVFYHKKSLPT